MKIQIPADLLRKAKYYFRSVYNDGDRIRVYFTGWQYETETVFRSAAALEKCIAEHEQELMEEFDFIAPGELRELGILC